MTVSLVFCEIPGEALERLECLPQKFYSRSTLEAARDILGTLLVHRTGSEMCAGMVVEVEAYLGLRDPASHAYRGKTDRNQVMFGPPGRAYVYFIYGNHFCLNAVAHPGDVGAVLIRALAPVAGLEVMARRRGLSRPESLTSGPGKLCQALGITREQNGADLTRGDLTFRRLPGDLRRSLGVPESFPVVAASRVGIRQAADWPYRYYAAGSPHVSRR